MKPQLFIFSFIFLSAIFLNSKAEAQSTIEFYSDIGENNVSDGVFVKTGTFAKHKFKQNTFSAGLQFDIISPYRRFLTGSILSYSRAFSIKEFPFEAKTFFMYNPFSDWVHESNIGAVLTIQRKHFTCKLGTNFRTYKLTQNALDKNQLTTDDKIHENLNLMYLINYDLKPPEHQWNAGISLTNIDRFIINQETNPVFYLHGKYKLSSPLTLYTEAWYQSAGSLNISVNYFGFFIRTGILWNINYTN